MDGNPYRPPQTKLGERPPEDDFLWTEWPKWKFAVAFLAGSIIIGLPFVLAVLIYDPDSVTG